MTLEYLASLFSSCCSFRSVAESDEGGNDSSYGDEENNYSAPLYYQSMLYKDGISESHPSLGTIGYEDLALEKVRVLPCTFLDKMDDTTCHLRWIAWGTDRAFQATKSSCFDKEIKNRSMELCEEKIFSSSTLQIKKMTAIVRRSHKDRQCTWKIGENSGEVRIPAQSSACPILFYAYGEKKPDVVFPSVLIPVDSGFRLSSHEAQEALKLAKNILKEENVSSHCLSILPYRAQFSLFLIEKLSVALQKMSGQFPSVPLILQTLNAHDALDSFFSSKEMKNQNSLKKALYCAFVELKGIIEKGCVDHELLQLAQSKLSSSDHVLQQEQKTIGANTLLFLDEGYSLHKREEYLSEKRLGVILSKIDMLFEEKKAHHSSCILIVHEPMAASCCASNTELSDSLMLSFSKKFLSLAQKRSFTPIIISKGAASLHGRLMLDEDNSASNNASCEMIQLAQTGSSPLAPVQIIGGDQGLSWDIAQGGKNAYILQ